MKFIFILTIGFLPLYSCVSNQSPAKMEVIEATVQLFENSINEFAVPIMNHKQKVWYKDSMAIEEVSMVFTNTDTANITTHEIVILNFKSI